MGDLKFIFLRELLPRTALNLRLLEGRDWVLCIFICARNVSSLALENKFKHPVHHLQIQVSNIRKSATFYGELLSRLDFTKVIETEGMVEWSKEGTRIIVAQSPKRFLADGYHRKRVGLNHIAFRASSRAAVDALCRDYLLPKKIPILYGGAREWKGYDPGYYAVYFEDPDRMKLELVYVPGDL